MLIQRSEFTSALVLLAICSGALAQTWNAPDDRPAGPQLQEPRLLLPENAYNPIPSPDGKYIAYVATGWGQRLANKVTVFGFGRSSLVSQVGLMDSSGIVLAPELCRNMFLTGWTEDSEAVVCYRDGRYSVRTRTGTILEEGTTHSPGANFFRERASFLADTGRAVWIEDKERESALRTSAETLVQLGVHETQSSPLDLIAPSHDGRYVAMMPAQKGTLWVYDRHLRKWANLGPSMVSPDDSWEYMKPSWDPWFADSSRLVYFSGSKLVISSPDGKNRRVLCETDQPAGLATASANGESVAFATFRNRPMRYRPDLKFWETTGIWVVPTGGRTPPRRMTGMDPDATSGLRWLGNDALVFDRIAEDHMDMRARIWKVAVH